MLDIKKNIALLEESLNDLSIWRDLIFNSHFSYLILFH